MKNLLFFAFALLLFTACTDEEAAVAADNTPAVAEQAPAETAANDPGEFAPGNPRQTIAKNSPIVGRPGAPLSSQTQKFIDFATTDYWEMFAYLRMSLEETERRKLFDANRGRWFDFKKDGTYVSGMWEEETGKGRWYYDPMVPSIYLDHDDRRDEEFTVKMNSDGTVMIWVGTKTFEETGVQVKMENSSDLPKKR